MLLAALAVTGDVAAQQQRPNILFIFTDDQPQACMGCLGNAQIQTPHIDRLAAEGVLFTNAFVTTAICCSNRACILTGQHMRRHGIRDFAAPLSAEAFARTYPALLRRAGYRTGYLGKYAIGAVKPEVLERSLPAGEFDFWFGFPQSINFRQNADGTVRYLTTLMEEKAVEFLRSNPKDQPFCLTVALKEPHGPWNYYDPDVPDLYRDQHISPPPSFTREQFAAQPQFLRDSLNGGSAGKWFENPASYQEHARTFYRLISRADLALGRIMAAVRDAGLDDNTVVIYSSDHGSLMGAHGLVGKWIMYEESIRIPLIIRDPRQPSAMRGMRRDEMALSIDLAPTMLALAGAAAPDSMQGRDLMPLVRGESVTWREDWYYEHTYDTNPPRRPIAKCEGVRTRDWKYTRYPDTQPLFEQLFDLTNDLREEKNLADLPAHRDTLDQLRLRCDRYRESLK